jgi:hypothetical protein
MDKKLVALLIISLGSFSAQVQAISEHHLSKAPIEKIGTVDYVLKQLPHFISFTDAKVISEMTQHKKRSALNTKKHPYKKMIQKKAAKTTGMFRRVVNAPSAGGKLNNSSDPQVATSKKSTMILSAKVASGVGLQNKDFVWSIKSADGAIKVHKKGKNISPNLPTGKYTVKLTIGGSSLRKSVNLGKTSSESFSISLGKVKSSVSFSGGSPKVSWKVYKMKGSKRGSRIYSVNKASSINRVLKPGKYEIVATMGSVSSSKVVTVTTGKTTKSSIRLEGSRVKLLVTKSDLKSPLIKKTKWVIKNTKTNKVVLTKNRHSATVTLPPGKYIASATSGGVTKAKNFVVKPGKDSNIFVAME